MTREALELIFISSALAGSALLLLSSVGAGLHVHLPVHVPHVHVPFVHLHSPDDATLWPMILGFLAMFGIGGLFGIAAGGDATLQVALALGSGAAAAALVFAIFSALRAAQGREPTALGELVGRTARVIVGMRRDARGTVRLTYDGAVQTIPAISESDVSRGEEVLIVAVRGMAVTIRSLPPP